MVARPIGWRAAYRPDRVADRVARRGPEQSPKTLGHGRPPVAPIGHPRRVTRARSAVCGHMRAGPTRADRVDTGPIGWPGRVTCPDIRHDSRLPRSEA